MSLLRTRQLALPLLETGVADAASDADGQSEGRSAGAASRAWPLPSAGPEAAAEPWSRSSTQLRSLRDEQRKRLERCPDAPRRTGT